MGDGFTAAELSRLAGFDSSTMLNYLERAGIFISENERRPHHGKIRHYTYRDLVVLSAIQKLLSLGARPKRISDAIRTFEKIKEIPHDSESLLKFSRESATFLVTSREVLFCEKPSDIINLTADGQLELAFMLHVPTALRRAANGAKGYEESVRSGQPKNISTLKRVLDQVDSDG